MLTNWLRQLRRSFLPVLLGGALLAPQAATGQGRRASVGAPVVLGTDTVLRLAVGVGAFSAAERARGASLRLERAAAGNVAVRVRPAAGADVITAGGVPLLSVTDADADAASVPRRELSGRWASSIATALAARHEAVRSRSLLLSVLLALLATLLLALAFYGLRRAYPALKRLLEAARESPRLALRLQQLELLSSPRTAVALLWMVRGLAAVLALALCYTYAAVVFSLFPATRAFAEMLQAYAVALLASIGAALAAYLPRLGILFAIAVVTSLTLRLLRVVFRGIESGAVAIPGFYADWATPTYKLVRLAVLVFAAILALPNVPGFGSESFRGVSLFFGLLVSLGSAGAVGNAVSGVLLVYMRPFRPGDRVRIADTEGDVIERTLLVTRVRTIKNVDVTVPNAMVLASHIVNYSAVASEQGVIVHTTVTIGYDAPWRLVHELLMRATADVPALRQDPPPFVLQTALNDFYVAYEVNAFTSLPNRLAQTYSELHQAIQDHFNAGGVEITSPHFAAVRDGNAVAVPAEYLPRGYVAPAFRVRAEPGAAPGPAAARPGMAQPERSG